MTNGRGTVGTVTSAVVLLAMSACGGGDSGVDASVDARRDVKSSSDDAHDSSKRIPDATPDHATRLDAGATEIHFIDASIQCEGGIGWGPCEVTDAAELACEASTDCTWTANGATCCGVLTIGVNKSAPYVGCPGLPCGPPKELQPACALFYTQDCQAVDAAASVIPTCVDHRCVTRAAD